MSETESATKKQPLQQTAVRLLVGIVLLGALFFGAQQVMQRLYSNSSDANLVAYTSERFGVTILRPQDWVLQESGEDDPVKIASFAKPPNPEIDPAEQFSGQLLVDVQEASSDAQVIEQAAFFEGLEQNIDSSLGMREGSQPSEEFAELGSKEEITVAGFPALKVTVNITNYDNRPDETGQGFIVFIYIDSSKQVTVLFEGHSSDVAIFESMDDIIDSIEITN